MEPVPLERLGLGLRDHRTALWWLGVLYRRPVVLVDSLKQLARMKQVRVGLLLWLHALPYVLLLLILAQADLLHSSVSWALFGRLAAIWIRGAMVVAILCGIIFGVRAGSSLGKAYWIATGIAGSLVGWIARAIALGIVSPTVNNPDIHFGIFMGIMIGICGGILAGIAPGRLRVSVSFGVGIGSFAGLAWIGGISMVVAGGIAAPLLYFRLYYQLIHPLFIWPAVRGRWYGWHPVAWDHLCSVPFPGFDRLLIAYAERNPASGHQEIERLITSYPSQRTAALRARTTLLARHASGLRDLTQLSVTAARLPEGQRGFLQQNKQVRESLEEIALQQLRLKPWPGNSWTTRAACSPDSLFARYSGLEIPWTGRAKRLCYATRWWANSTSR
jgi:MFS family permease